MAKGYVILTEAIKDPAKMADYGRAAGPSLREFDATVLVASGVVEVLEGTWHGDQTVVVEFDSVERARGTNQKVTELRHRCGAERPIATW